MTTERIRTPYGTFVTDVAPDGRTARQTLIPRTQRSSAHTNPQPSPNQPCTGCGGAKYNPQHFNHLGGHDALIQQLH